MSNFGADFDIAVDTWVPLANAHERLHDEEQSVCGGVGACTLRRAVHDRRQDILDALDEWRRRP